MPGNQGKKSSERKDASFKQQQRKNSAGGNKKENGKLSTNEKASKAAGAAILSAVTSPSNALQQPQRVGANGFNSGELGDFLNMRFSDTLTSYQNTNLDPSVRPEKHEYHENAWGNKGGVSGQKAGTMASGTDFLTELANYAK
ncbi:hypothetical protein K501DRAFT_331445 [Backusella circina FSU 941]|nr:hypothetical protein K501DRAFT_331445 [Backusella circina FSU 941]